MVANAITGGYSVQAQIALFRSIKPLFSNKLVFIVSTSSKSIYTSHDTYKAHLHQSNYGKAQVLT